MDTKKQKLEIGDFELGHLKAMFKGQTIAFVGTSLGLGIVLKGKAGYVPVPLDWFACNDADRSQAYADQLNQYALNIDAGEAMKLVAFSMFGKLNQE